MIKRQDQILDFITSFISSNQHPPTVQQITDAVGLQSKSTTHGHLVRLKEKGILDWDYGDARTLRLVEDQVSE
ncbi:transcriptional regulator [Bacillus sp. FJAT-26390]|uniref:LexA family protein n=1 Tax=Bacillus sp. FJAT-26390 TaxID=1743142 RepID=UPI00159EC62C|nr:transcriptional regulator [Bacillus sp. FJAT-26390]